MAFQDPFPGLSKPLSHDDLIRALRLDLAAEEEAVNLYMAHHDATTNPVARKVLHSIADEERVHAGEFTRLIQRLTGDEHKFQLEGYNEVDKMLESFSLAELKEFLEETQYVDSHR